MNQKDACLFALDKAKLFESSDHRTRFKELMDCYSQFPFFTKGLCKCMYLSAWDEPHFFILLEVLTDLSLGKTQTRTICVKMEIYLQTDRRMGSIMSISSLMHFLITHPSTLTSL